MRKSKLVSLVVKDTGLTKEQCDIFLDALTYEITQALARGEKVCISNFMSLEVSERGERYARNPATGIVALNPAMKTVRCRISQRVKDTINGREVE